MAEKAKGSRSRTVELEKKLALAVIREHGLPPEIQDELRAAGVSDAVIERIGNYRYAQPHNTAGYKRPKKKT